MKQFAFHGGQQKGNENEKIDFNTMRSALCYIEIYIHYMYVSISITITTHIYLLSLSPSLPLPPSLSPSLCYSYPHSQCLLYITAGCCLALGFRYAGSHRKDVYDFLVRILFSIKHNFFKSF